MDIKGKILKIDFGNFVLKGHIFITAGERSVTCGSKDRQSTGRK